MRSGRDAGVPRGLGVEHATSAATCPGPCRRAEQGQHGEQRQFGLARPQRATVETDHVGDEVQLAQRGDREPGSGADAEPATGAPATRSLGRRKPRRGGGWRVSLAWRSTAATTSCTVSKPRMNRQPSATSCAAPGSERRWALVRALQGQGAMSVQSWLAEWHGDVRRVHDDVGVLTEVGLFERTDSGGVACSFEAVDIDMWLQAPQPLAA